MPDGVIDSDYGGSRQGSSFPFVKWELTLAIIQIKT